MARRWCCRTPVTQVVKIAPRLISSRGSPAACRWRGIPRRGPTDQAFPGCRLLVAVSRLGGAGQGRTGTCSSLPACSMDEGAPAAHRRLVAPPDGDSAENRRHPGCRAAAAARSSSYLPTPPAAFTGIRMVFRRFVLPCRRRQPNQIYQHGRPPPVPPASGRGGHPRRLMGRLPFLFRSTRLGFACCHGRRAGPGREMGRSVHAGA